MAFQHKFACGRAAESHFKNQLAHIKTSCCTKSALKLWTASTGSTACQFAASQCGTWNKLFLLHKAKKNLNKQKKTSVKKCCCFFGGIYTAAKCSDRRFFPPPHILCCQGGWQNMRRCPPLTDTDQFLAGSRCLFPNMMTDCFNFPRHTAAMHQSQQQMAIKHLSHQEGALQPRWSPAVDKQSSLWRLRVPVLEWKLGCIALRLCKTRLVLIPESHIT